MKSVSKVKRLQLLVTVLLAPLTLWGQAASDPTSRDGIGAAVAVFERGLTGKDIETVVGVLSEDVSIGTDMGPGAKELLKVILANRDFEAVTLGADTLWTDGGMVCANVVFKTKQDGEQPSVVAFDYAGAIVFVDYFDRLFGHSRYRSSTLVGEIPFRLDGHSIVLTLRLNDSERDLLFLLDTGADGMAIGRTLADSLGLKADYAQSARVVGGTAQVNISRGNRVRLSDSLVMSGQSMAIFDNVREGMDGIIGLNLMKNYITSIDFDRQKIYLYSFGDYSSGAPTGPEASGATGVAADGAVEVPFRMRGGLILVPSVLGLVEDSAMRADFLFDTGADYKLIVFSECVRRNDLLNSGFRVEAMGTTVSLGLSTPVCHGTASELTVGDIVVRNVPVTLQAASQGVATGSPVDGSIGVRFWSEYNITIDLLQKQIHLKPRQ
jgi:predicted aspartyl protease